MAKASSINVTWEDQQQINEFSTLNQRFIEHKAKIKAKEDFLAEVDDAGAELMLSDDEAVRLRVGGCFWHVPNEDAEQQLDQMADAAKAEVANSKEQMEKVEGRMKELKAVLYAKFGSSINLEA